MISAVADGLFLLAATLKIPEIPIHWVFSTFIWQKNCRYFISFKPKILLNKQSLSLFFFSSEKHPIDFSDNTERAPFFNDKCFGLQQRKLLIIMIMVNTLLVLADFYLSATTGRRQLGNT